MICAAGCKRARIGLSGRVVSSDIKSLVPRRRCSKSAQDEPSQDERVALPELPVASGYQQVAEIASCGVDMTHGLRRNVAVKMQDLVQRSGGVLRRKLETLQNVRR